MPNVRSRDQAPIIIYIERALLDSMRRRAEARGITLVDLQTEYLDRYCRDVLGRNPHGNPTKTGR